MISPEQAQKELRRREARREQARRSVFHFLKYTFRHYKWENWHHKVVADFYKSLIERKITRGIVMLPPRHSKTEGCERAISWAYGKTHYNDDGTIKRLGCNEKVIHCSSTINRARKTSVNVKRIVRDNLFLEVFPNFMRDGVSRTRVIKGRDVKEDQNTFWELGSGTRGSFLAAGTNTPSLHCKHNNAVFIILPIHERPSKPFFFGFLDYWRFCILRGSCWVVNASYRESLSHD